MFTLIIHVVGAKDFVDVKTIEEAKEAWVAFRIESLCGASDMRGKCGDVYDEDGNKVAQIMYNGRIEYV